MSGFVVQMPKSDYRDSSGLKNKLYPKKKHSTICSGDPYYHILPRQGTLQTSRHGANIILINLYRLLYAKRSSLACLIFLSRRSP